jgi:hydrogenase-4 component B
LCIVLGLVPPLIVRLLAPVTQALAGVAAAPTLTLAPGPAVSTQGNLAPLLVLGLLVALGALGWLIPRLLGGPGHSRIAPPWSCGIVLEPSMQYSSMALAKPIRIIFRALVRPYRQIDCEPAAERSYFVARVRYEAGLHPVYARYIYEPFVHGLLALAHRVRVLQTGSVRLYLAYIFGTLVVVLLLAR